MAHLPKGQGLIPMPPFMSWLSNNVPAVYDNTMSYYEELCSLIKYLQDIVVPAVNHNAEALTIVSEALEQLKQYVDNYFANLDVQEEINNKLDQMALNGTLQEIITAYIQANVAWTFDSVADMKLATNLVAGSYAQTLGFHSLNDGGGATYYITDTGTANEMDVIAVGDLYANLVADKANVKQLGAYGDNTNDDTSVFTYALTKNNIYIPAGTYKITSSLNLLEEQTIEGESNVNLHYTGNGYLFNVTNKNRFNIRNLLITGSNSNNGINIDGSNTGCADFTIENVKIYQVNIGINIQYAWDFLVKNIRVISSVKPLVTGSQTNNATFLNCYLSGFSSAIECTNNEGIVFESCDLTNFTGSGHFIVFYQCKTTFLNCYYENLGSQRKNMLISANESVKSNITLFGGKVSKMDSTYPLTIQPCRGKVTIIGLDKGSICIVSDNYPNTVNQYCCGLPMTDLNLPSEFFDNRYKAVIDFKGDYEVTFNAYGALTQAFEDGEIALSTTGSAEYGVQIPVTTNKTYILIMDIELPEGATTVKVWQNANALARNVDVIDNKLIIPINTVSDVLRITFPYTVTPVKISRFYLGEI